jgi:cytochrome c oxidase assembly factor CtaG/ferredoxin
MSPTFDAFLHSWPFEPWLLLSLTLTAVVYLRGWFVLHRRDPRRWRPSQPVAFGAGLGAIIAALASPIEPFAAMLLQAHMLQHMLLTMIAPPLLWLGAPQLPLLRGLPRTIRTHWVGPFLRWPLLRRIRGQATHPVTAWLLFTSATWFWHLPRNYDLALRTDGWHYLQHACFIGTALLFWYPVIRPYPSRPSWSLWLLIPYLILADVQNTILSAVLTFSDRPLYSFYAERPRLGNMTPLDDQAAAGVLMWVPGSIAYLVPVFLIGLRLLFGASEKPSRLSRSRDTAHTAKDASPPRLSLPVLNQPCTGNDALAFDLLRAPIIGRFLRWRRARLSLQVLFTLGAALIVYDGFAGPQVAAISLAGVLPWIHWRALLVIGLLTVGNVFCMACPFTLPRTLARRWLPHGRDWPRWLRSKWLAVAFLIAFLWAYEAFALWDSPRWTAWIVLGYFAAALVVDGLFRGAAFCKYLCPVGQFNFVQSLVSPLEVKTRSPDVCATCETKECIRGSEGVPGCEMGLFQPRKSSNMDCTFCLDCAHACPRDNVGIVAVVPGQTLWRDVFRSGVGRFSRRPDLAALIVVLAFGAFVNAAGMVGPVVAWRDQLATFLTPPSGLLVTSLYYIAGVVVLPLVLVSAVAWICRWLGQLEASPIEVATRYSYALVPLGFSMWLAHYSFHFLASWDGVLPAVQRFAGDRGWAMLGEPEWTRACCRSVGDWLPRLEILFLDFGFLFSLYVAYRIALVQSHRASQALRILAPWAALIVVLFAVGVWIILQPMQMRGTLSAAG